jgi:fatty acid desaturase
MAVSPHPGIAYISAIMEQDRTDPPSLAGIEAPGFSLREARTIIGDLFEPSPAYYWADFLLTAAIGYGAALLYLTQPFLGLGGVGFLVSGFALFRAAIFIHELVHLPKQRMRHFRLAWNLLYGVPMLLPSFFYASHLDHHNWKHYGTVKDGEYLPLGAGSLGGILRYLATIPLLPLLAVVRFLVLTPLSLLIPPLRRVVLERFSALVIAPTYRRELPEHERRTGWLALELGCFCVLAGLLLLCGFGVLPWVILAKLYALGTFSAGINWVRTLAAHRYANPGGQLTFLAQLDDSLTIEGNRVATALLFPVGLRYHALHHIFPSLPYHAMGEAHRRLMAALPADSPYRRTVVRGFLPALAELLRGAVARGRAGATRAA